MTLQSQDRSTLIIGGIFVGLIVLFVAIVIGTYDSGEAKPPELVMDAGPPFSIQAQQDLLYLAAAGGINFDVEAGRCEVLAQILGQMERKPGHSTLTRKAAAAAAGPAGSLRVTIEQVTQDPEVLDAVGACVPYYVGR